MQHIQKKKLKQACFRFSMALLSLHCIAEIINSLWVEVTHMEYWFVLLNISLCSSFPDASQTLRSECVVSSELLRQTLSTRKHKHLHSRPNGKRTCRRVRTRNFSEAKKRWAKLKGNLGIFQPGLHRHVFTCGKERWLWKSVKSVHYRGTYLRLL